MRAWCEDRRAEEDTREQRAGRPKVECKKMRGTDESPKLARLLPQADRHLLPVV